MLSVLKNVCMWRNVGNLDKILVMLEQVGNVDNILGMWRNVANVEKFRLGQLLVM